MAATAGTHMPLSPNKIPKAPETENEEEAVEFHHPNKGVIFALPAFSLLTFYYLLFFHYTIDPYLRLCTVLNFFTSYVGFVVALYSIPAAAKVLFRWNLFGFDINKSGLLYPSKKNKRRLRMGSLKLPESLGIVVGIIYVIVAILFLLFKFKANSNWLDGYNAALVSICFTILLGFLDDFLDLPWRIKLILTYFAALPLLMAYAGHTTTIIPKPLIPYVGSTVLHLGWVYKLYMGLLAVFCTHSIKIHDIHARINGLEVGQTVVIASAIMIHNVMQIGASTDPKYKQVHELSIYLVQPLLVTSSALLYYNWYPSSVLVGSTFTYFAGMVMAAVGILGNFSETLLLFFLPQVLNFLCSCPQLFKIIPTPSHRLPRIDDWDKGWDTREPVSKIVWPVFRKVSLYKTTGFPGFIMPFLFLAEIYPYWLVQMTQVTEGDGAVRVSLSRGNI